MYREILRNRFDDDSSLILFDGHTSYSETDNARYLGEAISEYFQKAPEYLQKDCPELFDIVTHAAESGLSEESLSKLTGREKEFCSGLKSCPVMFTDIYNCYFDSQIVSYNSGTVFVDGGAQDLFTSYRFNRKSGGTYHSIHAFEPDAVNFEECKNNRELFDERLYLHKLALSDRACILSFTEDRQNSRIDFGGKSQVLCITLDDFFAGAPLESKPSFIKLHLEGSELTALKGAKMTLNERRPLIAVCIDHQKNDITDIPEFLLSVNEKYRFSLRHYSSSITETVLYAYIR